MPDPEQIARQEIDALLGPWIVQDKRAVNLAASLGVAVRELTFKTGEPDYTLFVDQKAIGTIEANCRLDIYSPVSKSSPKNMSKACRSECRLVVTLRISPEMLVHGGHGRQAAQLGLRDFPGLVTKITAM